MTFGHENLFVFGKFAEFNYTSRLPNQNGEICLQKYPPISGKVSITKHFLKNAMSRPFDHTK